MLHIYLNFSRRKKNKVISKHFVRSLLWYKSHNKYIDNETLQRGLTECYDEYEKKLRIRKISEYVCSKLRLNARYGEAMYCGEIIKFHQWTPDPVYRPRYKECFYQIYTY